MDSADASARTVFLMSTILCAGLFAENSQYALRRLREIYFDRDEGTP